MAQWGYRDWCYLDELGPLAAGAIVEALAQDPALKALAFAQGFRPDLPQAQSWREWGFRNWHVLRYLHAVGQQDGRR